MPSNKMRLIFGTARVKMWGDEKPKFFEALKKHGVKDLDTAHNYRESEKTLNEMNFFDEFIFHTKAPGFGDGRLAPQNVLAAGRNSKTLLKDIETYYLHSPDPATPITETLPAIQTLYKEGVFMYFGLSNFTPEHVLEIHDICTKNGYVLPTVYQGNYNAVARRQEDTLFPVLRKLGIRFYAYSPIAGGFLAKKVSTFTGKTGPGRFDPNTSWVATMYNQLYNRPKLLEGLKSWSQIADQEGISPAAMAYRWVVYHGVLKAKLGDGVIIGASNPSQVEESLKWIEDGPLTEKAVKEIDEMWNNIKDEAPIDNFSPES